MFSRRQCGFICFYFGRRGREGLCSMKRDTFAVRNDSECHAYVTISVKETTKNHQGGHAKKNKTTRINVCTARELTYSITTSRNWTPSAIGSSRIHLMSILRMAAGAKMSQLKKNPLCTMMQRIPKAGLSTTYTCHSVRASTVTTLYRSDVPAQSIVAITKHKNTTSLGHYISDISNQQKRECSSILTAALNGKHVFTTHRYFVHKQLETIRPTRIHNITIMWFC